MGKQVKFLHGPAAVRHTKFVFLPFCRNKRGQTIEGNSLRRRKQGAAVEISKGQDPLKFLSRVPTARKGKKKMEKRK